MSETEPKRRMVCVYCGSEQVLADAWAEWDYEQQRWVLHEVMNGVDCCADCEGETVIEEVVDTPEGRMLAIDASKPFVPTATAIALGTGIANTAKNVETD